MGNDLMTAPRYYCQPGLCRPAHIRAEAPNQLVAGAGPDGLGGCTYGGAYDPADQYTQTPGGWWVRLEGVSPRDVLRVNAIPGFHVDGWAVPVILRPDGMGTAAIGYWSADGFVVPPPFVSLVERMRAVLEYTGPVLHEHALIAADLLAVNHHISMHELAIWGVLTNARTLGILSVAAGVPPGLVATDG